MRVFIDNASFKEDKLKINIIKSLSYNGKLLMTNEYVNLFAIAYM